MSNASAKLILPCHRTTPAAGGGLEADGGMEDGCCTDDTAADGTESPPPTGVGASGVAISCSTATTTPSAVSTTPTTCHQVRAYHRCGEDSAAGAPAGQPACRPAGSSVGDAPSDPAEPPGDRHTLRCCRLDGAGRALLCTRLHCGRPALRPSGLVCGRSRSLGRLRHAASIAHRAPRIRPASRGNQALSLRGWRVPVGVEFVRVPAQPVDCHVRRPAGFVRAIDTPQRISQSPAALARRHIRRPRSLFPSWRPGGRRSGYPPWTVRLFTW